MKQQSYGYRGGHVRKGGRDALTSTWTGMPRGIVRSAAELYARLNGRRVDYLRAPVDEGRQAALRELLVKAAAGRA